MDVNMYVQLFSYSFSCCLYYRVSVVQYLISFPGISKLFTD